MTEQGDSRSLLELLTSLATEIPDLFRKEINLAKAEVRDVLDGLIAAIQRLALGTAFAVGAIGVLLAALVSGLTAGLVALGMEIALAGSLAATIIALVAGGVSWLMFASAVRSLRAARTSLGDTVKVLASSAANITDKF